MSKYNADMERLINQCALAMLPGLSMAAAQGKPIDPYKRAWEEAHKFVDAKIEFQKKKQDSSGNNSNNKGIIT